MPARKMRVEFVDEKRNRYTVTFEGDVTRKKALRLLDIIELLGGLHDDKQQQGLSMTFVTKFDKTRTIVEQYFSSVWFSSKEVLSAYEREFNEPISLSTASTYLSRLADRGFLVASGPHYRRKYRMITELAQNALSTLGNR